MMRSLAVFLTVAFGLSWLLALPLWLGDGLAEPWFPVVAIAVMMTPAIAALVVERSPHKVVALGLWPLRPVRRLLGYAVLGIVVSIALVLVALPVGALLGVYPADFVNFSAFQLVLDEQPADISLSTGALVALQLATLPLAAVINLVPTLGEELGWRGWLLPRLMPLGTLPAILISGVIWGLWHAPLILLGYNYPDAPGWLGLLTMVGMCTLVGAVFGWLRLRAESVWPAALAHAAFNGAGGTYLLFAQAGEQVDTTQATILGWSGWIVPLLLVAVLIATGQFAAPAKSQENPSERTAELRRGGRTPALPQG
ncbi:CPBP family intramembrane glutamic endopeptidase [Actinoplanes rectilineatus]|uniref:CPBP family intramembrane glutamic endopeptidase n=1 Tax=Actinoplanes rectilineatus TaxID=113571 RepID=UPI0005F2F840|nr:type II CAAX endopeptidase family protein [Actinoplanes rectilineatus]